MTESETNGTEGQKVTTQRINEMAFAFRNTGTLIAALELDLFTALCEGPKGPAEVAEKTGMPQESVERIMIACSTLKLIETRGAGYVNAPDVDRYLVRGKPSYFGDYLNYQAKNDYPCHSTRSTTTPPGRTLSGSKSGGIMATV